MKSLINVSIRPICDALHKKRYSVVYVDSVAPDQPTHMCYTGRLQIYCNLFFIIVNYFIIVVQYVLESLHYVMPHICNEPCNQMPMGNTSSPF